MLNTERHNFFGKKAHPTRMNPNPKIPCLKQTKKKEGEGGWIRTRNPNPSLPLPKFSTSTQITTKKKENGSKSAESYPSETTEEG